MSGKIRSILIPIVLMIVFFLLGILTDRDFFRYPLIMDGKGREREKTVIVQTLGLYNKIFNDIYSSGGIPAMLNDFPATKAVRHSVYRDIGFVLDAGRILVYDMAQMSPVDVKITSYSTAEAIVLEEWNYEYQKSTDRRPISRVRGTARGIRYFLVRDNSQWMVSGSEPVNVEEPRATEPYL